MKEVYLGIEFGSTRIKGVFVDNMGNVVAKGVFDWENQLIDGVWTYDLEYAQFGFKECYQALKRDYLARYNALPDVGAIGISSMMHGYIALDENDNLLTPFRTWRNTMCKDASEILSSLFDYPMPERFTTPHFLNAVLKREDHLIKVRKIFTLCSYFHYLLTGEFVTGLGDASGIFPIKDGEYDKEKMQKFNALLSERGIKVDYQTMIPKPIKAGCVAGFLTKEGAKMLDDDLDANIPLCAPEGDVQTGMVATNCLKAGQANLSCGTSAFIVAVLDEKINIKPAPVIGGMVLPSGEKIAMSNVNNFSCELNAYATIFEELLCLYSVDAKKDKLFETMFKSGLESDTDGGYLAYNFLSGESFAQIERGATMIARSPLGVPSFGAFCKNLLFSSVCGLAKGIQILTEQNVNIGEITCHGGFFKTEKVGATVIASALKKRVKLYKSASEGGAYGMAVLALYLTKNEYRLCEFTDKLFENKPTERFDIDPKVSEQFDLYYEKYNRCLPAERLLVEKIYD